MSTEARILGILDTLTAQTCEPTRTVLRLARIRIKRELEALCPKT